MTEKDIEKVHHSTFERLKHSDPDMQEFWHARDLQEALDYGSWDKFSRVVLKAMEACRNSGHEVDNHFSHMGKMVHLGSGSKREISDYALSRYACYLIVQNADPSKSVIANGQP
ncbi:MAG TPA: hypothetical protein ENN40_04790 [Candidatus Aminicenantes bacterium]|nr:hypothetical protein [Candidatus Aminicenantes bacterium]